MDELKPCPFCGGDAIIHNFKPVHEKRLWYISCHDCGIEQTNYLSEQEAIEAWNRRASDADGS